MEKDRIYEHYLKAIQVAKLDPDEINRIMECKLAAWITQREHTVQRREQMEIE